MPKPSCGFSSDRERPIFFLSWANQETTMPGKQAAEKGSGSDAASTPSNYLTIRPPSGSANSRDWFRPEGFTPGANLAKSYIQVVNCAWDHTYPNASTLHSRISSRLFPSRQNSIRQMKTLAGENNVRRYRLGLAGCELAASESGARGRRLCLSPSGRFFDHRSLRDHRAPFHFTNG